jgi:hypothetical protein
MRLDDRLLTGFQRAVEVGRESNVVGNESGVAKRPLQFRREVDENDARPRFGRCLFDLREALRSR